MEETAMDILKDLVNKEAIKPLNRYIKKYLKNLERDSKICVETTNLLVQANNTLQNVSKLLKNGEIVDSSTLMRSSMEKIMMAMMIYFDPSNTYEEFKNLEKCGKTINTRPTKVIENFKLKIKDINPFIYGDFKDEEISMLLNETYEKLCLYTHSSIAVSMMIEVNKNKDEDIFIAYFYLISDFLKIMLYCCLKYLCNDEDNHIDMLCLALSWFLNFSKVDINKMNNKYLSKYEQYLHWDINSHIVNKYNDIIDKIKNELKELNNEINDNKEKINEYFTSLLIKK